MRADSKPGLTFYTNMPTPYQLDFFNALKNLFNLHVVYFTARESDRTWNLAFEPAGYKVTFLQNGLVAKFIQKKVPSFHYDRSIRQIIKADDSPYVVVNGTYWSPNVRLAISENFRRRKFVAYWSEPVFPVKSRARFLLKKSLLSPVLQQTTCLLAIGRKAEKGFRDFGYLRPIYTLPYNIDVKLFERESLDNEIFHDLVNTYKDRDQFVFLSSGSLIHRKGIDTLIKAFKRVPKELNARLIIVGDGPLRKALEDLTGPDSAVSFVGFQEKDMMPFWFNLADAFVFASRYDGWGLVINEALAARKPVIASLTTGAAADMLNSSMASLLDPEDINAYAEAMISLCSNPTLVKKFVDNSQPVREELSSESNAKKLYDICASFK